MAVVAGHLCSCGAVGVDVGGEGCLYGGRGCLYGGRGLVVVQVSSRGGG